MERMSIDLSPITNSPHYTTERKSLVMSGKKKSWLIFVLLFFCFLMPLTWFGMAFIDKNFALLSALVLSLLFILSIPLAVIWLVVKAVQSRGWTKTNQTAMQAFAERNGFSYKPAVGVHFGDEDPPTPMVLPYKNVEMTLYEGFKGKINDWPFDYGSYVVRLTNVRRSTSGGRALNVFRLQLPIDMPRLLVNARHNNMPGFEIYPDNFNLKEEHRLEGDFPKYYTVLAERSERIPAIAVLSPEVMQALKEHNYFDVWIQGKELMLITNGVNFFPTIPDAFKTIEVLMEEIDVIARSVNAQRRGNAGTLG